MVQNEGQLWYSQECFYALSKIAKRHDVFVFKTDLEDTLQKPSTSKYSKSLHALDAVHERIAAVNVPKEFVTMVEFLRDRISKQEI